MDNQITVQNNKSLTPQQISKAEAIAKSLDISNQDSITNLGLSTQQNLGSFSNELLDKVRSKDSGDVGETINNLLSQINHIDVETLKQSKLASIPVIGPVLEMIFQKGKKIKTKYESVASNIDDIVVKLDRSRVSIGIDNALLGKMFEKNVEYIQELDSTILAGNMKIDELKQTISNFSPNDGMEDYEKNDVMSYLHRLEKKVHDLALTKTVAIQSLPQIRMIEANNRVLQEKIISSVNNTLPLWRSQVVISLSLEKQRKMIEIQDKVTKTTNDILAKNSELLKINTVATARANESSIVSVETLKKVNSDLIHTLDEIVKIKEEGTRKRSEAEAELGRIENELKGRILSIKGTSVAQDQNLLTE